ncbi:hypothetical protein A2686_02280 [Candidatus Woesebacteria bacterium RIFCSPHIGHO2_01_FULL_38_10]|uniref:SCP domain-containing protein n=1 Tax=Candidatus Woesebacteria bacterium RIFCSPLOWO2_01_FULL_39_10b TaxID=1802517 RepID=A0A1F8BBQ4_9BACT|nr:MAG: hypothetical protein A2686_02280 [Candidatus Woesebacteria bacterium RIFCSPHIGHO2_01_FULL_38_10]OGM60805.1 MAG: hypothetical protein A2892_02055 [Candidatus Woesebacteria bacterium RIFCSPLOWO2_01_FULL_39_10b]
MEFSRYIVILIAKVILVSLTLPFFLLLIFAVFRFGYFIGFKQGQINTENYFLSLAGESEINWEEDKSSLENSIKEKIAATPTSGFSTKKPSNVVIANWGGPELWQEVNKKRQEFGVNSLDQRDELCTIASIRLNELLELGKLDGHQGFSNMQKRRSDLEWIFEKYSTLAEFLAFGGSTPGETVSLWENTLGHRKLLTGGEYVWGCIYAQNTFAVAITAF